MNAKERKDKGLFMSYAEESLDRMLTLNEVAYLLHVHPSTVRRWEKNGQLRSYRLGPKSVIRFKKEDVADFVNLTMSRKMDTACRDLVISDSIEPMYLPQKV